MFHSLLKTMINKYSKSESILPDYITYNNTTNCGKNDVKNCL